LELAHLSNLAAAFRRAIEETPVLVRPFTMSELPHGSCGDAALLLGTYLAEAGFPEFLYVSAERGMKSDNTWTSHAWLAKGSLVVDITADQFDDGQGPT